MKLSTHIKRSKLSVCDWSDKAGLSHTTVRKALNGDYTTKTAKAIYDHTDQQVRLPIKKENPYAEN